MSHKWPLICSLCRDQTAVLSSFMIYHRVSNKTSMTGATSGAGNANSSGAPEFTPGFKWGSCCSIFSFPCCVLHFAVCSFSFLDCIVCPSIYSFRLPHWYLQLFLFHWVKYWFVFHLEITLFLGHLSNKKRIWQKCIYCPNNRRYQWLRDPTAYILYCGQVIISTNLTWIILYI